MGKKTPQQQLLERINQGVDSFENYFDNADDQPKGTAMTMQRDMSIGKIAGNPQFDAQFDISVLTTFYTVAASVYTAVLPAALNAALKTPLAFFLFGWADFKSGYSKLRTQFVLQSWVYEAPFVYGKDVATTSYGNLSAAALANLQIGDVVIPFTSGALNTCALVVIRCTQVAYATLLESLSSDRFAINYLRYVINDNTQYGQYSNNVGVFRQTMFGKFNSDFTSPNSFKQPDQNQAGIIDVPIKQGFDKNTSMGSKLEYTANALLLSLFVKQVSRISV